MVGTNGTRPGEGKVPGPGYRGVRVRSFFLLRRKMVEIGVSYQSHGRKVRGVDREEGWGWCCWCRGTRGVRTLKRSTPGQRSWVVPLLDCSQSGRVNSCPSLVEGVNDGRTSVVVVFR